MLLLAEFYSSEYSHDDNAVAGTLKLTWNSRNVWVYHIHYRKIGNVEDDPNLLNQLTVQAKQFLPKRLHRFATGITHDALVNLSATRSANISKWKQEREAPAPKEGSP